jgi:tetratricopeptide (TPR) repeat protein
MKGFFGSLFGKEQKPGQEAKPAAPVPQEAPRQEAAELYRKGDVIDGRIEIHGTLGKGGFGVVYLAYSRETKQVCALKTFRDELLADAAAREAFKKEALLWVNLEEHSFILAARWVQQFSGRLFVAMDYVAPDAHRLVSLADHLARAGGPFDAGQTLKWAVQFCLGMEHAQAHGINCHRDIKPANILITQEGTLKVSDFGLAAAAEVAWRGMGGRGGSLVTRGPEGSFGLSLMQTGGKARCGTPGYMAPEVYRGEGADIRSDIYGFGLVLWQMATGSPVPPFVVPYRGDLEGYLRQTYEQQMIGRVPCMDGFLGPVIERCLRPKPAERYGSFGELRGALEPMLERTTGKKLEAPQVEEKTAVFWNNKGVSLAALGRRGEAITCYDQALAIDPRDAAAWNNKGLALRALGRRAEAVSCCDQALAIDPRYAAAWNSKGLALAALGRREEAISCYDQALTIYPRDAMAWSNKGIVLADLGRREEAIRCYDQALAIDPRYAAAWNNKGLALADLGRREEGISCYDQALAIDPRDAATWCNKGLVLVDLGRREEGISCCDQALAIDARFGGAWNNKGIALAALGRHAEAINCYDQVLAVDPRYAQAWNNKGLALADLSRRAEAISCYDQALAIDPRYAGAWNNKGVALAALGRREEEINCYAQALAVDPRDAVAWYNKALVEDALGRRREAAVSYSKFLELAPPQHAPQVAHARQRVIKLESHGA